MEQGDSVLHTFPNRFRHLASLIRLDNFFIGDSSRFTGETLYLFLTAGSQKENPVQDKFDLAYGIRFFCHAQDIPNKRFVVSG